MILAPMGGGPGTAALAAAVNDAGGLGSIGGAYLTPAQLDAEIADLRRRTPRPFAVNLFIPAKDPALSPDQIARARAATRVYRHELGLPDPALAPPFAQDFEKQAEVVLRHAPAAFSFVFGRLDAALLKEFKKRGVFVIGTATSAGEARLLQDDGVDAIVLQGAEAGGHRGLFDDRADDHETPLPDLLRETARTARVPLIAAGGLMNGRQIAAVLRDGAQAAQLGTAYLACPEAGTSAPYRERLLQSGGKTTRLTRAFSGRWARGLENRFMTDIGAQPESILPFPAQNAFTRDLRTAAARAGRADLLSLWAGTGAGQIRTLGARELTETLFAETAAGGGAKIP